MATIKIKNITKSYANTQVIHGIDVEIADGEFIVMVGPSGCGKSTLLRMVAGLESVSGGEILIDDEVVNDVEPKDRGIAMVFQNYALYPHMTVYGNMAYGLKLMKLPKDEIDERVQAAAKTLQLTEFLQRRPNALSGGQRQRVAMGRAIVRKPKVFLFDEPLSNLDAKLRVQMRMQIKTLQRSLGVTCLYVTHDQVEAMTMADRLIVINAGVAAQIGTPMELYENPQDRFVAGFIGSPSMNFINCQLDNQTIRFGSQSLPVPDAIKYRGDAALGIRPEHFIDVDGQVPEIKGTVEMVEKLGASLLMYIRMEGVADLVVVERDAYNEPAIGELVTVGVNIDKLYFFNDENQRRVY